MLTQVVEAIGLPSLGIPEYTRLGTANTEAILVWVNSVLPSQFLSGADEQEPR